MKIIYKYPLTPIIANVHEVNIFEGAEILSFEIQDEEVVFWALVDTDNPKKHIRIAMYTTGRPLMDVGKLKYLSTLTHHFGTERFCMHFFEIK